MTGPPTQCFVSYAHADHEGFERLVVHLTPVAHLFGFKLWHDRRITPGDYWNHRINTEIANSQIFILLTTNDFLASSYILLHELPAIIREHRNSGALVIPIIYRNCAWSGFFGNYIQAVPTTPNGRLRPIINWPKPEDGFAAASNAVQSAIVDWFGVAPKSPMAALGIAAP